LLEPEAKRTLWEEEEDEDDLFTPLPCRAVDEESAKLELNRKIDELVIQINAEVEKHASEPLLTYEEWAKQTAMYDMLEGLRREREMDEELVHPDLTEIPTYLDSSDLHDEEGWEEPKIISIDVTEEEEGLECNRARLKGKAGYAFNSADVLKKWTPFVLDPDNTLPMNNRGGEGSETTSMESNSNNKENVGEENMNPGEPEKVYVNSDNGLLKMANNIAARRWHTINGLDLNSPLSSLSVGSCVPAKFGRSMLESIAVIDPDLDEDDYPEESRSPQTPSMSPNLAPKDGVSRKKLSAASCSILWTFITTDDGLGNVAHCYGDGWLEFVSSFKAMIKCSLYPPVPLVCRIMYEGLLEYPDPRIRFVVYSALTHLLKAVSPGPGDPTTRIYYLSMMKPLVDARSAGLRPTENDPWLFLVDLMKRCVVPVNEGAPKKLFLPSVMDGGIPGEPVVVLQGAKLLLQFWVDVLEVDFREWFDYCSKNNRICLDVAERPLLARVIFKGEEVRWTARCSELCTNYVAALTEESTHPMVLSCSRRLIGMLSQLLGLREVLKEEMNASESELNLFKLQMARCLARLLNEADIPESKLKHELFLLEPCWLSSTVSTLMLGQLANIQFKSLPGLKDIVASFVNVSLDDETQSQRFVSSDLDESLESHKSDEKEISAKRNIKTPPRSSKLPTTRSSKRSIDFKSRNKYGEYKIHTVCKQGDKERLQSMLMCQGVDVNVVDNNLNTPLHEAVDNNRLDCVKLLLNFVPFKTMDAFYPLTPKRGASLPTPSPKATKSRYVNLLAKDGDNENPFVYAAKYDRPEILTYMLDFVKQQGEKNSTHFPAPVEVLNSVPKGLEAFCKNDKLIKIVAEFRKQIQHANVKLPDDQPVNLSTSLLHSTKYNILIRNSLSRYIGAQNLFLVYRLWKIGKTEEEEFSPEAVLRKVNNGCPILQHEDLRRFGPVDARPFSKFGFGSRFDLFRSSVMLATDIRSLEALMYPEERLPLLGRDHPVRQFVNLFY